MVERRVSGFQEGQNDSRSGVCRDSRSGVCRLILLTVSLMLMPPLHPLCAELEVQSSREVRQDVLLNPEEAAEGDDPFEDVNRFTFSLNEGVDTLVLLPLTALYRFFVPSLVKEGVQNVLENLSSPVSVVNYTLQGDGAHAGQMLGQFLVNSLVGLGGVFSVARHFGFDVPPTGFGQTLGVWGGGSGPYLIWPFWGPSTPRDSTGLLVDFLLDPINILAFAKDRWRVSTAVKRNIPDATPRIVSSERTRWRTSWIQASLSRLSAGFMRFREAGLFPDTECGRRRRRLWHRA